MKHKAFTLIELLVVVAIIGTLSSIVIANVVSARNKAKDNAIKAELKQLVTQLENYYNDNGTYQASGGQCSNLVGSKSSINGGGFGYGGCGAADAFVDANSLKIIKGLALISNRSASDTNFIFKGTIATDKVAAYMELTDGSFWCVDNQGRSMKSLLITDYTLIQTYGTNGACV